MAIMFHQYYLPIWYSQALIKWLFLSMFNNLCLNIGWHLFAMASLLIVMQKDIIFYKRKMSCCLLGFMFLPISIWLYGIIANYMDISCDLLELLPIVFWLYGIPWAWLSKSRSGSYDPTILRSHLPKTI